MFKELGIKHKTPAVIWCDNAGAKQLSANPVFHNRSKHIEVDIHYVRDLINQGIVEVRFVPTTEQTADIFTKAVSIDQFNYLRNKLTISEQTEVTLRETVKKSNETMHEYMHVKNISPTNLHSCNIDDSRIGIFHQSLSQS